MPTTSTTGDCPSYTVSIYSTRVFAVELFDGYLYLILDHNNEMRRERVSNNRLNTGTQHQVHITLKNWGAVVEVSY